MVANMNPRNIDAKPEVKDTKPNGTSNGVSRRWFGVRLLDAALEARARTVQKNDFRRGLTATDAETRSAYVSGLAEEAKGNVKVAKLVVDQILKSGDYLAVQLIDQFIKLYPTLSQKHRGNIFERIVNEFVSATNRTAISDFKAVRLARMLELIGKESKTTYKDDEGPMFDDKVAKLITRLREIINDDFQYYHENAAIRVACARVGWAFDGDTEFLNERLHDSQTAEFAVEAMMSTSDTRTMLVAKAMNGDAQNIAVIMSRMPEEKVRPILLSWIFRGDERLAVYALAVVAVRQNISDQFKLAARAKLMAPDGPVKRAAMDVCANNMMPVVLPHLLDLVKVTKDINVKQKCVAAMAKFAANGNMLAKEMLVETLKSGDHVAKNLAIGYSLVNGLHYTIPTLVELFRNRKENKETRDNVQKVVFAFAVTRIKEAVDGLVEIQKIRSAELTDKILRLKHTALQGTKAQKLKAMEELEAYAARGLRQAINALVDIDRAKERSKPWKLRDRTFF